MNLISRLSRYHLTNRLLLTLDTNLNSSLAVELYDISNEYIDDICEGMGINDEIRIIYSNAEKGDLILHIRILEDGRREVEIYADTSDCETSNLESA